MTLLTDEIRSTLPKLYSQESEKNPLVHIKFFTPWTNWTWFATEGEPQADNDFLFFGYVVGLESEWGYFTLEQLKSVCGPGGLKIERDLYFTPGRFSEVVSKVVL